jgi:hypothetical protein
MQAMVRRFCLTLTVLGSMIVGAGQAQADLVGLTVHGQYLFPNTSTVFQDLGNAVITPGFVFSFTSAGVTVTIDDSTIDTHFAGGAFAADFNGPLLTIVGPAPAITGVTIDPASNVPGFDSSRLLFTSDSISQNIQGLAFPSDGGIRLNVQFGTPVPEPSSFVLAGTGVLLGVGWTWLRRKRATAH